MNRPSDEILRFHHASIAYGDEVVLLRLDLTIAAGEFVGVVGPNGAGKSTLLNAVVGIARVVEGEIAVGGVPASQAHSRLAYMPQREAVDWSFPVTVFDAVLMGRQARIGWLRRAGRRDRDAVAEALQGVGMWEQRERPIANLSGGQQQRVFLARTLAQEGDVLLLDEPLTGVDAPTEETILSVLHNLHLQGRTLLMSTHDLSMAGNLCSKLLFLNRRIVAYGSAAETLTPETLRETYGGHVVVGNLEVPLGLWAEDGHHSHAHGRRSPQ